MLGYKRNAVIYRFSGVAIIISLLVFAHAFAFAQNNSGEGAGYRGSIPEELLRPRRGEAPRYPVDTVIGEIGQGKASAAAYAFARSVAAGLVTGRSNHPGLATISPAMLEGYLAVLGPINPQDFRLGGGRDEPDGAVSFLVRFLGREKAITGELFVRLVERHQQESAAVSMAADAVAASAAWVFEELILEEARSRDIENEEVRHRFDFSPYERFF